MNQRLATTAKRLLGEKRAAKAYLLMQAARWMLQNTRAKLLLMTINGSSALSNLNRFEAKHRSQFGEDGIIEVILRRIGTRDKTCGEIGVSRVADSGKLECNTAHLVVNKGWRCTWIDGKETMPPVHTEFVTAENVADMLERCGMPKEPDVFSIDIDYNTYWILRAVMSRFRPRVVVTEYNAFLGPDDSKGVPYDPNTVGDWTWFGGASLMAFATMMKGYSLVACDNSGNDAFFVRNDAAHLFALPTVRQAFRPYPHGFQFKPSSKEFIDLAD